MVELDALVADIDARLRADGTPERAEKERAYLKSALEHYGTSVPAIRKVAKAVRRRFPDLERSTLLALVDALWQGPVHERRLVTVALLDLYPQHLRAEDMDLFERLLREARTWAIVDWLATSVVGSLVEREPAAADVLDRWSVDDDLWVRRAALLALLVALRRGGGDFERFGRYADGMLGDSEFFIRKAIGWVLRDTAKRRPDVVHDWLLPRAGRASGVTVREAVKPLSEGQRQAILAAR